MVLLVCSLTYLLFITAPSPKELGEKYKKEKTQTSSEQRQYRPTQRRLPGLLPIPSLNGLPEKFWTEERKELILENLTLKNQVISDRPGMPPAFEPSGDDFNFDPKKFDEEARESRLQMQAYLEATAEQHAKHKESVAAYRESTSKLKELLKEDYKEYEEWQNRVYLGQVLVASTYLSEEGANLAVNKMVESHNQGEPKEKRDQIFRDYVGDYDVPQETRDRSEVILSGEKPRPFKVPKPAIRVSATNGIIEGVVNEP